MRPSPSSLFFSISYFFSLIIVAQAAEPNVAHLALGRRTDTVSTFTLFTPSPGADPIPITSQSQAVTSYVPIVGSPIQSLPPFKRSKIHETALASNTQKTY